MRRMWIFGLVLLFVPMPGRSADWPQFRGPGGAGVADDVALPERWGPSENIRWKADLPGRGLSCPVVAAGKVFVTACSGYQQTRLHILCFDLSTGRRLWERQLWATGNTLCNPKTCMAAPTPVTNGRRVFALFATGDLVALDAAGDLLWYRALARDYPNVTNQVGMAASPVLWQDVLIVPMESDGDSFVAGLDARTGQNRWKQPRPRDIVWTTPLLLCRDGQAEVLIQSPKELAAYDPATGNKRWRYNGRGLSSVPSLIAANGLLVLPGGVSLRPPALGAGLPTPPPEVAWKTGKMSPAYSTPLVYRDRLYTLNNPGTVLNCLDPASGKVLWQERVRGPFSASPVAGDGKIYLVNEEGATSVVRVDGEPKVLAVNTLPEAMLATPAIADGAILLRSDQHLYCVGAATK